VFIETYHFELYQEGLSFLGILVGAFLVIPPFFLYLRFKLEPQFDANGEIQPEKRLPPTFVGTYFEQNLQWRQFRRNMRLISAIDGIYTNLKSGAFCIPICLFWFGWSARPDVHWSE
jgi:DHA1 family multidrug resistance protein-like MFS transporter